MNTITLPVFDYDEEHYVEIIDHEGDELLTLTRTELEAIITQGIKLVGQLSNEGDD